MPDFSEHGRAPALARTVAELILPFAAPYDFAHLLAFFGRRAIPGIEVVDAHSYRRRFEVDGRLQTLDVRLAPDGRSLRLRTSCRRRAALAEVVARVRRMFDLDADIAAVNAWLGRSAPLRRLVAANPGQRVPGGWDGFEIAVRAVLGQQVSVAAARTLTERLVQRFGTLVKLKSGDVHLFPSPQMLAAADLSALGVTRARAAGLRALAQAVAAGDLSFEPAQPLDAFVERCVALPGIGPWTAHYIAMRGLHHPDAFPTADLVLCKALARGGVPASPAALTALAERWRPYRAFAVLHLWRSQG